MAGQQNKTTAKKEGEAPVMENAVPDVNAMVEEILKKAQMSAEEIVNNAVAKAGEIMAQAQQAAQQTAEKAEAVPDDGEELVEIRLPLKKNESDLFVAVNGVPIQIQRGKTVKVKKKFAEVIRNSVDQDEATLLMISGLTAEFESKRNEFI